MTAIYKVLNIIKERKIEWDINIKKIMPDYLEVNKQKYSIVNAFIVKVKFNIFYFLGNIIPKKKPPKFIFQGLRHVKLIEQLPKSDILILGGVNDLLFCFKNNYRFYWVDFIYKAFELFINKNIELYLHQSILTIQKYIIHNDSCTRYLFLWEDTQPVGLTLSSALSCKANINVVCIAHGFFPLYKQIPFPIEGGNCKFNLVWNTSQKKIITNKENTTFVLGLPYNVDPPSEISQEVIIIGHSGPFGNNFEYQYTYNHFIKLYSILLGAGFNVSFRPHPMDDMNYARSVFSSICTEEKYNLLSKKRMTFIGFTSSLLYEAINFGNIVVALDDSKLNYKIDFAPTILLKELNYKKLPDMLKKINRKKSCIRKINHIDSLKNRFDYCIISIDNYNKK